MIKPEKVEGTNIVNFNCVLSIDKKNETYLTLRDKLRGLFGVIWRWVLDEHVIVELTIKATRKDDDKITNQVL